MSKISLTLLVIAAMAFSAAATIHHVPGQYAAIQTAVNACAPGDTVMVAAGFYQENLRMTEGVTLLGAGADCTTIDGGGVTDVVYAYQVNDFHIEGFTVQNSQQGGSTPGNVGVFINPRSSTGIKVVRNCIVKNNGNGIDIWNDFGGTAYIDHNLIINNIYEGFDPYLGTVYLTNNTIAANGRDGYHDWSGGGAVHIKNNIIANNGRYGIYKHRDTPVFISYNDVYNNPGGNYMQGYSGPATPFTPNPGTGEIQADPLFVGGATFDYHLTWANFPIPDTTMSPCIDSGDPATPLDPDSTLADMGCFYFDQGPVSPLVITLTPHNPPILIPAGGGQLTFTAAVENTSGSAMVFDAWSEVIIPNGATVGPLILRTGLPIPAGATISRQITQVVPGTAPPGNYTYVGKVGSHPDSTYHSHSFPFTKLAGEAASQQYRGWAVYGWFGDEEAVSSRQSATGFFSSSPNPFNASTALSFKLQAASNIRLAIYDIAGREVEVLAEGFYPAGVHQAVWDASGMASGVYFARFSAEGGVHTQKLLLVK